jgi:hypothetical protein
MPDYSAFKTQFVQQRLRETRWEDRQYVQELMAIERLVLQGGPRTAGARLIHERLVRRYPVEYGIIANELRRGELTSDGQFKLLLEAQSVLWNWQDELDRRQEEQKQKRKEEKLNRERTQWHRMGGLE